MTDPERDVFQSPESTHTTRASIHHRPHYIRHTFPIQFPSNSNRIDTRSRRPHPRNVHLPHLLAEADADDSLSRPLLSAVLSFARRAFAPARVPSSTPVTVPSLASLALLFVVPSIASRRLRASILYRAFGGDMSIIVNLFVVVDGVSSSTMVFPRRRAPTIIYVRSILPFPNTVVVRVGGTAASSSLAKTESQSKSFHSTVSPGRKRKGNDASVPSRRLPGGPRTRTSPHPRHVRRFTTTQRIQNP